jgi:hypothetical protein
LLRRITMPKAKAKKNRPGCKETCGKSACG